jgi:hypothetical protein
MRAQVDMSDRQAERLLVRALKGRGGRLTAADAQVLSGLPAHRAKRTLTAMLAAYRSHLAATESGELLYAFDPALRRRDAVPWSERLERAMVVCWRAFVLGFKLAIVTVLAVYFVAFLALLLVLVVTRLASSHDDSEHGDGILPLGLLWWVLPWDFGLARDDRGRSLPGRQRPRKKLHQQVFDFVFGPARPAGGPDGSDREILAYIRAHQGRITAAELVALRGLDFERAEEEATRLLCDHDGEPEVTDDGVVVYVFRELRKTSRDAGPGHWSYAWERLEKRPVLTGNTKTADLVIGALNGFNLVAPLWFVPAALTAAGLSGAAAELWLRVVPVVFAAVFFAVPAGRALQRALADAGRRRRNRRRLIVQGVFGGVESSRQLVAGAAAHLLDPAVVAAAVGGGAAAEEEAARRELDALLVPLGGDLVLEGDAEQLGRVAFPRLAAELAAVRRVRETAPAAEATVDAIVFDTAASLEAHEPAALAARPIAPSPWRLPPATVAIMPGSRGRHGQP